MPSFAKSHEVTPDFFRGINRQRVARRIIFKAADQDANDFSLEIQNRRAGLAALRGQVHP